MKILCFGDPEGKLQLRRRKLGKVISKYDPDYVIFLGDYFSMSLHYLSRLKKFKKSRDFYDLFPEAILVKNMMNSSNSNINYVFVYGNKDIDPAAFRLRKIKENMKPDNFIMCLNKHGKFSDFYILNGSILYDVPDESTNPLYQKICTNMQVVIDLVSQLREEGKPKSQIKKEIKNYLLKTTKDRTTYRLLFYSYVYSFQGITKVSTDSQVLLTHTPPYLKNSKILFGNFPDYAIYKIIKEKNTIQPAYEDDPNAIKKNVGEKNITKFILKNNFDLVICGHIHEGSGIALIKETNTIVVNPGSIAAFQNRENVIPYALIELKRNRVIIYLKSWLGEKRIKVSI